MGNSGRVNVQPDREVSHVDEKAQCYAFPVKKQEASDAEITCTILVCGRMANMLFDPDSTYSYVSMQFSSAFKMMSLPLSESHL